MDTIAFIVNKNFILVAVDANYEAELQGIKVKSNVAKKFINLTPLI